MPHTPKDRKMVARSLGRQAYIKGISRNWKDDTRFMQWLTTVPAKQRASFKIAWLHGWDLAEKKHNKE